VVPHALDGSKHINAKGESFFGRPEATDWARTPTTRPSAVPNQSGGKATYLASTRPGGTNLTLGGAGTDKHRCQRHTGNLPKGVF